LILHSALPRWRAPVALAVLYAYGQSLSRTAGLRRQRRNVAQKVFAAWLLPCGAGPLSAFGISPPGGFMGGQFGRSGGELAGTLYARIPG
jgi:hypothetical protein